MSAQLLCRSLVCAALAALLASACDRTDAPQPAVPTPQPTAEAPADLTTTQTPMPPAAAVLTDAATPGRIADGSRLATQGLVDRGVAPCTTCHGQFGEGSATAGFPRLAGQPLQYLRHQLDAYADGMRRNAVMQPIAQGLSAEQRLALAAYYATRPAAGEAEAKNPPPAPSPPPRGEQLARLGDERIQACVSCHGPGGSGLPPIYPYLAGQHASYLKPALRAWADGSRRTDPSGQMTAIAAAMTPADIEAVAAYFASLPPPPHKPDVTAPGAGTAPAGGG